MPKNKSDNPIVNEFLDYLRNLKPESKDTLWEWLETVPQAEDTMIACLAQDPDLVGKSHHKKETIPRRPPPRSHIMAEVQRNFDQLRKDMQHANMKFYICMPEKQFLEFKPSIGDDDCTYVRIAGSATEYINKRGI